MGAQSRNREADLRRAVRILTALEPATAEQVLSRLPPSQRTWLQQLVQSARGTPQELSGAPGTPESDAGKVPTGRGASPDLHPEGGEPEPTASGVTDRPPPFAFLETVAPEVLARVVADERPGTVALVVSCAPLRVARGLLAALPEGLADLVRQRLSEQRAPAPGVLRCLSDELEAACARFAGGVRENRGVSVSHGTRPELDRRSGRAGASTRAGGSL